MSKNTGDGQLRFNVIGGPHDGDVIFWPPPFRPIYFELGLYDKNDSTIGHVYLLSRIDWTARYKGSGKKRTDANN